MPFVWRPVLVTSITAIPSARIFRARSRCSHRARRPGHVEMLKLVLADVEAERDRLRSARASFSTRLGPLPASVAVVTGIAAAAAGKVDLLFAILAGVVFAGVLAVSIFFGGLKPYREI